MRKVSADEVISRAGYEKVRADFRAEVMRQKSARRVHLGDHFTFLFENHDTVLYQIQEMIRAEGIEGEEEIRHEIDTYNELLGEDGELGVTLLIEVEDPAAREKLLSRWKGLPQAFYIETADGRRVSPVVDARQVGEHRISSVHYLKFPLGSGTPRRVGCSHPEVDASVELSPGQVEALTADLGGGSARGRQA